MCVPSSFKGSKFGHAWVIFQPHIQEMINWSYMLDLTCAMILYLGEFNFGLSIISIIHFLSKLWGIETSGPKKVNLVLLEQSQKYQFLKGHNLINSCPILKKFSFLWSGAKDLSFCQVLWNLREWVTFCCLFLDHMTWNDPLEICLHKIDNLLKNSLLIWWIMEIQEAYLVKSLAVTLDEMA